MKTQIENLSAYQPGLNPEELKNLIILKDHYIS